MGLFDLSPFTKKGRQSFSNFFTGTAEKHERVPTFLPGQQPLYEQLLAANKGPGAGGAFGQAGDYYRDLLSDDSSTFNAMQAPEMRRFNEDIIPGLSEQFAGMGSGGLSSSGFRNAAVSAGTDLSERLGAIRAQLRQQGAAGLMGLGQQGLGSYSQDVMTQPGTEGFLSQIAPAAGAAAGAYAGVPGSGAFNWLSRSNKGRTSPYGGQIT